MGPLAPQLLVAGVVTLNACFGPLSYACLRSCSLHCWSHPMPVLTQLLYSLSPCPPSFPQPCHPWCCHMVLFHCVSGTHSPWPLCARSSPVRTARSSAPGIGLPALSVCCMAVHVSSLLSHQVAARPASSVEVSLVPFHCPGRAHGLNFTL